MRASLVMRFSVSNSPNAATFGSELMGFENIRVVGYELLADFPVEYLPTGLENIISMAVSDGFWVLEK